jgi:hypothetical protein
MQNGTIKGAAIAGALAAMLAGGLVQAQPKTDKASSSAVKCNASNDCKGKGGCKSAKNDCKGHNACKGQSFTMASDAKECAAKGGSVVSSK